MPHKAPTHVGPREKSDRLPKRQEDELNSQKGKERPGASHGQWGREGAPVFFLDVGRPEKENTTRTRCGKKEERRRRRSPSQIKRIGGFPKGGVRGGKGAGGGSEDERVGVVASGSKGEWPGGMG